MSSRFAFLDTSSLEAKAFNLCSELFASFSEACHQSGVALLLPRGTEHEIERRMADRATEAVRETASAIRKAPFLQGWIDWPKERAGNIHEYEARRQAKNVLAKFWKRFSVIRLDHAKANLAEVMHWYEQKSGPFGTGRKKHEFPDAFAISSLLAYARENHCEVAIVSLDHDFQRACEQHHELLYFSSFASLTESLLGGRARIEQFKATLDRHKEILESAIWDAFTELSFRSDQIDDAEVTDVEIIEIGDFDANIIAIGEREFTVEFSATVSFGAHVSYDDPDSYYWDPDSREAIAFDTMSGTVSDAAGVYGIAKLCVRESDVEIVSFELEPGQIDVTKLPDDGGRD